MKKSAPTPFLGRFYLGTVIVIGTTVAGLSATDVLHRETWTDWGLLAALTLLTGSFTVKIPGLLARISVSDAFVFASVLLFGPSVATVIVAIDSVVATLWMRPEHRSITRSLFNLASAALSIWIASHAFFYLAGIAPGMTLVLAELLAPLFALAALYFLTNSWLVAYALSFEKNANVIGLWWANFPWLSLNYFGGVSVAALVVTQSNSVDFRTIGIIIPLLLITYLTYRHSLARLEDAQRHVSQVNELYLSTIEALAMAVDAKDQITHGHIRRVQVYAVELAKRLGLREERQLKALETAALLHDMGKLAIPEHILNKPGKLTTAEFDKMKRHADIGADLLSSIRFPYPVVPIVRHHHENWDGRGYPAGIAGPDIPLGARILSVVDCFDALTSDRPYRPALDREAAFDILRERRASMYDPLVVDTFIDAFDEIAPKAIRAGQMARTIAVFHEGPVNESVAQAPDSPQSAISAGARLNIGQARSASLSVVRAIQSVNDPTSPMVCALFVCEPPSDSIRCSCASGQSSHLLLGLSIPKGERVSGWVAATGRPATRSQAVLDIGQLAQRFDPPLEHALSYPVTVDGRTIAVVTAYSPAQTTFDSADKDVFMRLAAALAIALKPDSRETTTV